MLNFIFFFIYNLVLNSSASALPCLFATLTEKYSEKKLKLCETKSNQHWRHASGNLVMSHINHFTNYFPELSLLIGSLENHTLCEGHYNQIISNDNFLQYLQTNSTSSSSSSVNTNTYKRRKNIYDSLLQPPLDDTEIRLPSPDQHILSELERTKERLKNLEN